MKEGEVVNENLSVVGTFAQLVKSLGFHDTTSFVITSLFLIVALAFVVACVIVLVKKQRERREVLREIVKQVQSETPQALVEKEKPIDVVPETIEKRAEPSEVKPKKEEKVFRPRVEQPVVKEVIPPARVEQPVVTKDILPPRVEPPVAKKEVVPPRVEPPVAKKEFIPPRAEPPVAKKEVIPPRAEPPVLKKEVILPREEHVAKKEIAPSEKENIVAPAPQIKEDIVENALEQPSVPARDESRAELGAALKNTRGGFIAKLARLFSRGKEISDDDFEEMEAILFTADIGAKTAQKLLDGLRERVRVEKNVDKAFLRTVLKEEICQILNSVKPAQDSAASTAPKVIMFVGVNGAGKTTSIGKLGAQYKDLGKTVLFGAGDTFRAAATLQLSVWGERIGAPVIGGKENSDSASVLFEAINQAKADNIDYVLCDTAGRLHTKTSLMDELKKVYRVIGKAKEGAPHEVFLVIDATMGQNAISQAREFAAATPITGVILSKLDGTAKGGVAIGIVDELKLPIRYVGIGEKVSDLKNFNAEHFVDALFDEV